MGRAAEGPGSIMGRWPIAVVLLLALLVALVLGAGCTSSERPDPPAAASGDDTGPVAAGDSSALRWRPVLGGVVCDGTERLAGTIEEAQAGEAIEVSSPMPIPAVTGPAGADGRRELRWRCEPSEAQLRWDVTATGAESGRLVAFTVEGAPTPATERPLEVTPIGDELVCDGTGHDVASVTGFDPGERVLVTSIADGGQVSPRADDDGSVVVTWSCRPDDVGRTWRVNVVAEASDRLVAFDLVGVPGDDGEPLAVVGVESSIVCDGRVHVLGTVTGLFPFEVVTFASPGSTDLRDGRADGAGRLDLRWQCDRSDGGTSWELTAMAAETGKTATVSFSGIAGPPPESAVVELVEDPFVCDGERRVVARLEDLGPGEFVDFTSPNAGPMREGRATAFGALAVNWQCSVDELDGADRRRWEVTATGRQSGRAVTFDIVGVQPGG